MPSSDDPSQRETYIEPDCPNWLPGFLDPEPGQCWCLRCSEPLPCACSTAQVYTPQRGGDAA
jgi:hypothetical protein